MKHILHGCSSLLILDLSSFKSLYVLIVDVFGRLYKFKEDWVLLAQLNPVTIILQFHIPLSLISSCTPRTSIPKVIKCYINILLSNFYLFNFVKPGYYSKIFSPHLKIKIYIFLIKYINNIYPL